MLLLKLDIYVHLVTIHDFAKITMIYALITCDTKMIHISIINDNSQTHTITRFTPQKLILNVLS